MCKNSKTPCASCLGKENPHEKNEIVKVFLTDSSVYDNESKTVVSVRDGVLPYLGSELNVKPYDKLFLVYRPPEEIEKLAKLLVGIPITEGHVSLDEDPKDVIGKITGSEIQQYINHSEQATVAVKNTIELFEGAAEKTYSDASLGYWADLVPAGKDKPYDFLQINVVPHHLAKVTDGRCGEACNFNDGMNMKIKFRDEDGTVNLEEMSAIIADFPRLIGDMDIDEAKDLILALKEVRDRAINERDDIDEEIDVEVEDEDLDIEEKEKKDVKVDDADLPEDELMDEDLEEDEKETLKIKSKDSRTYLDGIKAFVDSKVKLGIQEHSIVVEKARNFLDSKYDFSNKGTKKIMRDTLKTQYRTEKFADSELKTAFKLMKKSRDYSKFADTKAAKNSFQALANKGNK